MRGTPGSDGVAITAVKTRGFGAQMLPFMCDACPLRDRKVALNPVREPENCALAVSKTQSNRRKTKRISETVNAGDDDREASEVPR